MSFQYNPWHEVVKLGLTTEAESDEMTWAEVCELLDKHNNFGKHEEIK